MSFSLATGAYRTLGNSGLVVSPLALGTMTFGTARWGTGIVESRAVFNAYVDGGGNFVDTADVYSGGRSEEMLGEFIAERSLRERVVIATKAGFATGAGVHSGGNGARHLHTSLEKSLRRLRTDYVDLFWVHVWDAVTPPEELLETMSTLVRSGKIRYWGMSNTPAWYVAKVATLALMRGTPGPIALQYFYSLVNRDIEDEHVPMAQHLGLGLMPWSPLAYGLLAGKYDRAAVERAPSRAAGLPRDAGASDMSRETDDKRLDGANPFGDSLFTERNWRIVDVVKQVAAEVDASPAHVALAWVMNRPAVSSTLMGASRESQVTENFAAQSLQLSSEQVERLNSVSAGTSRMLYSLFTPAMQRQVVFGGHVVTRG